MKTRTSEMRGVSFSCSLLTLQDLLSNLVVLEQPSASLLRNKKFLSAVSVRIF